MDFVEAYSLIESLRSGDSVEVTKEGRTGVYTVYREAHLADAPYGPADSLGVVVSLGVGRYAFRVSVRDLVPRKAGPTTLGGGATLRKI